MASERGDLAGRTALVTGASRGIGRTIAEQLADGGARVVCAARSANALAEVVAGLPGDGHLAVAMDVADPDSTAAALAQIAAEAGRVDVLINNAGVADSAPFERTDDAMWQRALDVNVTGAFRLCRALIPAMVKADWGRVVVVASNAGLTGYAYTTAYCASKHAVVGMVRAIALEIAKTPVTINAICPGFVDTPMTATSIANIAGKTGKSEAEARKVLERMSPQRRLIQTDEVAAMVATLCSDDARGIHGQAIAIDGGQTMH